MGKRRRGKGRREKGGGRKEEGEGRRESREGGWEKVHLVMINATCDQQATNPNLPHDSRSCLEDYIQMGYCPMESDSESVSLTLSYAFDDW